MFVILKTMDISIYQIQLKKYLIDNYWTTLLIVYTKMGLLMKNIYVECLTSIIDYINQVHSKLPYSKHQVVVIIEMCAFQM